MCDDEALEHLERRFMACTLHTTCMVKVDDHRDTRQMMMNHLTNEIQCFCCS